MTTFALLPAGGHSVRMGRPKLALPLGNRTVLEQVILALRTAGLDQVLVVIGPHVAELAALAERAGASIALLPQPTADMRATVAHGLDWMVEHWHSAPTDNLLLVPADHPTLAAEVVRRLLEAQQTAPHASIFIPTFAGKRGHPALIGWHHVAGLRAVPAGQGLNTYLRQQADQTLEVSVAMPEILVDLDTPEDYERLVQGWGKR